MAIISTETLYVCGRSFKRKIKCDADGYFTSELPAEVSASTHCTLPSGRTIQECKSEWGQRISEYESSETVERKVICYEFDTDISFAKGISLSLSAAAYLETEVTTKSKGAKYSYSRANVESSIPHDMTPGTISTRGARFEDQIPWTPEADAFFCTVHERLGFLIAKLKEITKKPEALEQFVASGLKLEHKS